MEGGGFFELAEVGVAGCKSLQDRGILAGAEVIVAGFSIEILAGELEGIRQIVGVAVGFRLFAERAVSVEVLDRAVGVDHLPNAQARRKGGL